MRGLQVIAWVVKGEIVFSAWELELGRARVDVRGVLLPAGADPLLTVRDWMLSGLPEAVEGVWAPGVEVCELVQLSDVIDSEDIK